MSRKKIITAEEAHYSIREERFIPLISRYKGYRPKGRKVFKRRPARYAPELIALGLSSGIISDKGNLVAGVFDEVGATAIDPFCNIESDKFMMMQEELETPSPAPAEPPAPAE
ncbi:MAG: hypothetical protein IJA96_05640 [Alistipes sp.]|nr:hypothetical protein [Alistipes sp.]